VLVRITREGGRADPRGWVQCILERATTKPCWPQVERMGTPRRLLPLDDRLLTSVALPASDGGPLTRFLTSSRWWRLLLTVTRGPVSRQGSTSPGWLPINGGEEPTSICCSQTRSAATLSLHRAAPCATRTQGRLDLHRTSQPLLNGLERWRGANLAAVSLSNSVTRRRGNGRHPLGPLSGRG